MKKDDINIKIKKKKKKDEDPNDKDIGTNFNANNYTNDNKTRNNVRNTNELAIQIKNRIQEKDNYWFGLALNPEQLPELVLNDLYEQNYDDLEIGLGDIWNMSAVIFGQRRTGKSFLVRDLLVNMKEHIGRIGVITSSDQNNFWKKFIPNQMIFPVEKASETIKQIMDQQAYMIRQAEKKKKLRPEGVIQFTLILDDFAYDKTFARYSNEFAKVYTVGRHYAMVVIVLTQHPTGVSTYVRGNSDYVFIVKAKGKKNKIQLASDHLEFMPELAATFLMQSATIDHKVLVINLNPMINEDEDRLCTYLAHDQPKIQLGDPEWLKLIGKTKKQNEYGKRTTIDDTAKDILAKAYGQTGDKWFNRS